MNIGGDRVGGVVSVPTMVAAGLERCEVERRRVMGLRPGTHTERAARAQRLAVLFERSARWWNLLGRWSVRAGWGQVPAVFGDAVIIAAGRDSDQARFWRDMAGDWLRHAAGEPVCDVIGCGCGGVCGVSA